MNTFMLNQSKDKQYGFSRPTYGEKQEYSNRGYDFLLGIVTLLKIDANNNTASLISDYPRHGKLSPSFPWVLRPPPG